MGELSFLEPGTSGGRGGGGGGRILLAVVTLALTVSRDQVSGRMPKIRERGLGSAGQVSRLDGTDRQTDRQTSSTSSTSSTSASASIYGSGISVCIYRTSKLEQRKDIRCEKTPSQHLLPTRVEHRLATSYPSFLFVFPVSPLTSFPPRTLHPGSWNRRSQS